MRPPLRSTRSSNSPTSPSSDSRPKPTIADVAIAPRQRLRDGRSSSRGRSSRGNSVVSSASSRASSANRATTTGSGSVLDNIRTRGRGRSHMADTLERRRSLTSTVSVLSESDGGSYVPSTNGHSHSNSRDSSLSPPPPETSSITIHQRTSAEPPRQRRSVANRQSILDVMDEYQNRNNQSQNIASLPIVNNPNSRSRNDTSSSSSSSSSSDSNGGRRYTAQEKGKGRAVVTTTTTPIEIESSSEEPEELKRKNSIQFIDIHTKKRRRKSDEDMIDELISNSSEGDQGVDVQEDEVGEEDTLAGGYTCPVCFCPPSQAVMTPCGHILCAQCLHSSLLAAIGRNPNPYPDPMLNRSNGRHPSRGRNNHIHKHPEKTVSLHGKNGGPTKWTKDLLIDFWLYHLNQECERSLTESEVPKVEWEGIKAVQIPSSEEIKVEQKLRGLWRVEESWVVEGECPVCRNPLPGGYGPYGTGIGGIIPLQAKLSSSAITGPKRKRE